MPTSTRSMARKQYSMTQEKSSIDLTRRAIDAAAACARRLGLRVDDPLLLHDASNVLVHLRPAPVVARVATTTAMSRGGGGEHLAREVAVAGRLARGGAPVIAPSGEVDPGPHTEDGLALSFWELAERLPGPPSPAAAGRALRECHEALVHADLELPPLEALHEAGRVLDMPVAAEAFTEDDMAMLHSGLAEMLERLSRLPLRPVHGDSHLSNVMHAQNGTLWFDWEDAFAAPVEWDLGVLLGQARIFGADETQQRAALAAYGQIDEDRLDLMIEARALQIAAWAALVVSRRPHRRPMLERNLQWLRARPGSSRRPAP
jgi:phosphotransferase family enzyme